MDILRFMRDHEGYFEDYVTRSTYNSNAIEGNTLSYDETRAILWGGGSLELASSAREFYEAVNHKRALTIAIGSLGEQLSERLVKEIAACLSRNVNEIDGYRRVSVMIRGAAHMPPAPNQVNQRMMQLVYEHNHSEGLDPFLGEALFHLRFERIHPFEDGNGRTGRILINQGLMKSGYAPAVIPFEERETYFGFLANVDADGLATFLRSLSELEAERMRQFERTE